MFAQPLTILALVHSGTVPHVHPHEAPVAIALALALLVGTVVAVLVTPGHRPGAGGARESI
jgi:hypothetical protein